MVQRLTREQARRIAVRAQLLSSERPADIVETIDALTIVNIVLIALGGSLAGGAVDLIQRFLAADALFAYHRWVELALGFALITTGAAIVYRFGPPPPRYPASAACWT